MTDRVRLLTVLLDQDYRTDDVQAIVQTIAMIKGVESVALGDPVAGSDYLARDIARIELRSKFLKMLEAEDARRTRDS